MVIIYVSNQLEFFYFTQNYAFIHRRVVRTINSVLYKYIIYILANLGEFVPYLRLQRIKEQFSPELSSLIGCSRKKGKNSLRSISKYGCLAYGFNPGIGFLNSLG